MSERKPLLSAFDDDIVEAVAGSVSLERDTLQDLLVRHQRLVGDWESVGGVDGLVYEWRTTFETDPLARRTDDAYYLDLNQRVWDDFAERLGLSSEERGALLAVHARQFRDVLGSSGRNHPMVLVRPSEPAE